MKPQRAFRPSLRRAMSDAHSGVAALVPPIGSRCLPSMCITTTPLTGSASAATSGTPRPTWCGGLADGGTLTSSCHDGLVNSAEMPPPPAPSPCASSFHTTSDLIAGGERLEAVSFVPPTPSTYGLDAGKSTCAPLATPSLDPSSPEAQQMVMPVAMAAWNAWFTVCTPAAVQAPPGSSSGLP